MKDLSESARTLGRKGGQAKTPAKASASRANGKNGGRPKLTLTERLDRSVLKEHSEGRATVRELNENGTIRHQISALILRPADIQRAEGGLETGWITAEWSVMLD